MKNLVNEELNKMKYLLGYQRGMVISEQASVPTVPAAATTPATATATAAAPATATATAAAPATVADVIKQIQEVLNDKYEGKLVVDGKWGNLTQTAFDTAVKSKPGTVIRKSERKPDVVMPAPKKAGAIPPSPPPKPPKIVLTPPPPPPSTLTSAPQTNRDKRRDRQDMDRGQRRDRQDLRAQQRAQ